jgi:capsular exopolysaccharide synthesis family protein
LRVTLAGEYPHDLALIVNGVVNAYLEEIVNADQSRRRDRLNQLEQISRTLEDSLREKHAVLKRLAEQLETADPNTLNVKDQLRFEYYTKLRTELVQVRSDLIKAQITYSALKSRLDEKQPVEGDVPAEVIEARLGREPAYLQARTAVEEQRRLIASLSERFGPNHPRLIEAQADLEQRLERLRAVREELEKAVRRELTWGEYQKMELEAAQMAAKIELLDKQRQELESQLSKLEVNQSQSGVLSFELESIRKEITQIENIANKVNDEIEHLRVELKAPPRITLFRSAEVPKTRNMTKKYLATLLAGLGVFGLILGGAVWWDFHSGKIALVEDLSQTLHIPIVGNVPVVSRSRVFSSYTQSYRNGDSLVESIDAVRTMVLEQMERAQVRVIMVTSSGPSEGKTSLATQLASSLARSDRKTLVIDADVRRPRVHRVFRSALQPGLSELLQGTALLDDTIKQVNGHNLSFLPAGVFDEEYLRQLAAGRFGPILDELRKRFDVVIVDSSPLLVVPDGLMVAKEVDGVLFAVRRDVSRLNKVAAAVARLAMLDVPILGAVTIGLDESGIAAPDYYYGVGYGYGHYGYRSRAGVSP